MTNGKTFLFNIEGKHSLYTRHGLSSDFHKTPKLAAGTWLLLPSRCSFDTSDLSQFSHSHEHSGEKSHCVSPRPPQPLNSFNMALPTNPALYRTLPPPTASCHRGTSYRLSYPFTYYLPPLVDPPTFNNPLSLQPAHAVAPAREPSAGVMPISGLGKRKRPSQDNPPVTYVQPSRQMLGANPEEDAIREDRIVCSNSERARLQSQGYTNMKLLALPGRSCKQL